MIFGVKVAQLWGMGFFLSLFGREVVFRVVSDLLGFNLGFVCRLKDD